MEFVYTPELLEYMCGTKKDTIVVELVEIGGDIDVTELHVRLINARQSAFFREKKNYRVVETAHGTVLLPQYPLKMEDTVTFGLKKILFFKDVSYQGIKL